MTSGFLESLFVNKMKGLLYSAFCGISALVIYSQYDTSLEYDDSKLTKEMKELIDKCPSLKKNRFKPTIYLPIGFFHLIYGGFVKTFDPDVIFTPETAKISSEDSFTIRIFIKNQ